MWVVLGVVSAFLLGIYDIFKKLSLKDNAVVPVLFFSTLVSSVLFLPFLLLSYLKPEFQQSGWYIAPQSVTAYLCFFSKSVIVSSSWLLAYFAMKNLPITIASPIRSSGPLWTLAGALLLFNEKMNFLQWTGLIVSIGFYYLFSFSGKKEGITFRKNKWVLFMILATIIGTISSLYDKFLIAHLDRLALQSWFSIYMVPITGMMMYLFWLPNRKKYTPFRWRYTIILIGITLTIADFAYFKALSYPDSLIAILSTVRRSSIVVSFSIGGLLLKDKNMKNKALILLGILTGIGLLILGNYYQADS